MAESMRETDYLELIEKGLAPLGNEPKRVIVLGAGMAGLVAAEKLLAAGHDPLILEAQQRVGGRIYTIREPFLPGLHGEVGAMRIPHSHRLTMAYVEKFKLPSFSFTMNNPMAYICMYGVPCRAKELDLGSLGFELHEHERGKSTRELIQEAVRPLQQRLVEQGDDAWADIVAEYDDYSLLEFMEANNWSGGAIEMVGMLAGAESRFHYSFVEFLRGTLDFGVGGYLVQIEGGMDLLPRAFLPMLQKRIRFGARVTAVDQSPEGVTVHYRTRADRFQVTGDYVITTIPFSVFRHIEVSPGFSRRKQRAIRQLNYDAATKIFLQCNRRFWEEDDGIYGGYTITDNPVRNIYYPEHGRESGRGILLASYTWAQDAQRWGSLSKEERVRQSLECVSTIHPQVLDAFEVGASHAWHDDEFAGGAGAMFEPGQEKLLHDDIMRPEGRIHFAGEHTSLSHRWIQGAIESGLRAAHEVHHTIAAG
jgi:monoamine oxidase